MITPKMTEVEVQASVGPNAGYYLSRWKPLLDGQDWSGFNWAACIFSGLWLPYRKMYLAALVYYGFASLDLVMEHVASRPGSSSETAGVLQFGAAVVCGAFGNQWYFRHTAKLIAEARARALPDAELSQLLCQRGGTSVLAPIGFMVALGVVAALVGS